MRRRTLLSGVAAGLACPLPGCLHRGEDPGDPTDGWTGFQADAARTGATGETGPDGGGRVRWWSHTTGLTAGPVIRDDAVVVGSGLRNQSLFAFDRETGERRWRAPIGDDIERAIAVGNGTVYAAADGVYAFDADTGDREWTAPVGANRGVALDGETVYASAGGGGPVVALDAADGDQRWSRDVHTLTAPTASDGHVYVVDNSDLVALDADTGDTEWTEGIDRAGSPPTVADGTVFVTTRGDLFAHDAATGEREWRLAGTFRGTDAAVADGTLYLTGRQEEGDGWASGALAVDAASGDVEWALDDEALSDGSVAVAAETVFVATRYRLYALDRPTGEVDWWLRFQWPVGAPAVADGTLYVGVGGRLLAVGSGDGRDGVWESDADPRPSRDATPPAPTDADSDFAFGVGGYEVDADWDVTVDDDAPVDVCFSVTGDRIDDDETVRITLAVTNEGAEPLSVTTGAPEPFGIFSLRDDDHGITAWTVAYEESGHVGTAEHRGVTLVNSIALATTIAPGETVSETYTLSDRTHGIRPGAYEFSVDQVLRPGDGWTDEEGWAFDVTGVVDITASGTDEGDVVADLVVSDEVDLPEEFMGEFTVDVLEPVTDTHPGLIEVTLENVTDERSLIASMRRWPFGSYVGLGPAGRRLVLLPAETYAPGFVERTDSGWWEPAFLPHDSIARGGSTTAYDPGETVSKRFVVTSHPETDAPRDGDGFAFEQGFGDDDADVLWGFTLTTIDA